MHAADSLRAAGADYVKVHYFVNPSLHDSAVAALRTAGYVIGGHDMTLGSGARLADHGVAAPESPSAPPAPEQWRALGPRPIGCDRESPDLERCRQAAERMRREDMWMVVCPLGGAGAGMSAAWRRLPVSLRGSEEPGAGPDGESGGEWTMAQQVGLPVLAATDFSVFPWYQGYVLHDALSSMVWLGFTPLTALQAATLNPAKALHATDSLGTVAKGKLADLVLLDANPLVAIANTQRIYGVVANGRYFDRAALDSLLADIDYNQLNN